MRFTLFAISVSRLFDIFSMTLFHANDSIHLELRFLVHATAGNIGSVYVAERLVDRIVYGETWPQQAKVLLYAADKTCAFHRNFLQRKNERIKQGNKTSHFLSFKIT